MKQKLKTHLLQIYVSVKEKLCRVMESCTYAVTSVSKFIQEEAVHRKVILKPLPVDPR